MTERNKENAVNDWMEMIRKSWTYELFSEDEKNAFQEVIETLTSKSINAIKGSYKDRWTMMHCLYKAFLAGAGYPNGKFKY